jgi:hypothetical protein
VKWEFGEMGIQQDGNSAKWEFGEMGGHLFNNGWRFFLESNDTTTTSGASDVDSMNSADKACPSTLICSDSCSSASSMCNTSEKLPACWTIDQWSYFSQKYDWLFANSSNGTLGCSVCRQVSNMHLPSAEKISLAMVWVSGTVCDSGGETKKRTTEFFATQNS